MLVPSYPRVFVCFSFQTHTSYHLQRGLFFTPRNNEPTKCCPRKQKKINELLRMHHQYAWPANHTRYIIFMRTNAHTNFSGREGKYTDFLCKKWYIAITANRSQDQPRDIIHINTMKMWITVVPIVYTVHCTPALSQKQNLTGSKQSCHELEYPFENNIINEK